MQIMAFNRWTAWLGILLLWLVIYLPSLGRPEVQSNEPKRMLPAERMLESGDWITPEFCGEKYYKKPPLINWMIAASYRVCGEISEFAARLPSVLMVLAAASVIVLLGSSWFPLAARFIAALAYLTTYAVIESGRLCEIEATLMSLTAMVTVWWLSTWIDRRSPWLVWLGSGLILGAGMLLKGPAILLFFYVLVLCAAGYSRRWKELLHPAHFVGLALMVGMFMAWAWPGLQAAKALAAVTALPQSEAASTWRTELLQQVNLQEIKFGNWIKQILFAVAGFLPWLPLLLLWFRRRALQCDDKAMLVLKSLLTAMGITFVLFNLMPGTRARYSAPLCAHLVLICGLLVSTPLVEAGFEPWRRLTARLTGIFFLLVAVFAPAVWMLENGSFLPRLWSRLQVKPLMAMVPPTAWWVVVLFMLAILGYKLSSQLRRTALPLRGVVLISALAVTSATMFYSVLVLPVVCCFEIKRPAVVPVNRAATEAIPICIYRNDMPFQFYLRRPLFYVTSTRELPDADVYLFLSADQLAETQPRFRELGRQTVPVAEMVYKKERYLLLRSVKLSAPAR